MEARRRDRRSLTERRRLAAAIQAARRRVAAEPPFSPSWDAAMAALEELERASRQRSDDRTA